MSSWATAGHVTRQPVKVAFAKSTFSTSYLISILWVLRSYTSILGLTTHPPAALPPLMRPPSSVMIALAWSISTIPSTFICWHSTFPSLVYFFHSFISMDS